jgi:RNA 3'-phosphate cyclase
MEERPLRIDGSYGEGGGQILRTALLLSLLTGRPFEMFNIRKGRSKPGLKPQHLHILKALQVITESTVEGATQGSLKIFFKPGPIKGGDLRISFGTAGSIPLFLQTILPIGFFADRTLRIDVEGGTDVPMSMTLDYTRYVIVPLLAHYAKSVRIDVMERGYYPKGGGRVRVTVEPMFSRGSYRSFDHFMSDLRIKSPPLLLHPFEVIREVRVYSVASELLRSRKVAERQLEGALEVLKEEFGKKVRKEVRYERSRSPGCSILVVAIGERSRMGGDAIGKPGKPAEEIGREAASNLLKDLDKGSVDSHLGDNLVPWLALFGGRIKVPKWTNHLNTNIWITEQFLGPVFKKEGSLITVT